MKKSIGLFMCIILSACLCACAHELPPDSDTPWPQNHDGVFTSEYGTLTFNGDGESIVFNLTAELAEAAELPRERSRRHLRLSVSSRRLAL